MVKQRGMTAIGWMIVLGLIGFFAMLVISLLPVYMESFSVNSHIQSLKEEPNITKASSSEIKRILRTRFDIDDVHNVDVAKDVTIEKEKGVLKVTAKYKIQKHLFGNIDLILSFDQGVEIIQN